MLLVGVKVLDNRHICNNLHIPANPDIAKVFFRAGYIEELGRGTVNVVKYCTDAGRPEPIYTDNRGGVAVIFIKKEGHKPWEEDGTTQDTTQETKSTTQEILNLINLNPKITRKEIAEKLSNITEDGVKYQLNKLKKQGIIKRIGSTKGGHWEITK